MYGEIESLVRRFEAGRITRRELIAGLLPLVAATAARSSGCAAQAATQAPAPIEVSGLDHIALRVADPVRSAKFYTEHLGATPRAQSANSVFLNVGRNWIALFGPGAVSSGFPPTSSGMDHFAFHSVKQRSLEERMGVLRAHNLNPVSPAASERVYFRDPDGIILQLS